MLAHVPPDTNPDRGRLSRSIYVRKCKGKANRGTEGLEEIKVRHPLAPLNFTLPYLIRALAHASFHIHIWIRYNNGSLDRCFHARFMRGHVARCLVHAGRLGLWPSRVLRPTARPTSCCGTASSLGSRARTGRVASTRCSSYFQASTLQRPRQRSFPRASCIQTFTLTDM